MFLFCVTHLHKLDTYDERKGNKDYCTYILEICSNDFMYTLDRGWVRILCWIPSLSMFFLEYLLTYPLLATRAQTSRPYISTPCFFWNFWTPWGWIYSPQQTTMRIEDGFQPVSIAPIIEIQGLGSHNIPRFRSQNRMYTLMIQFYLVYSSVHYPQGANALASSITLSKGILQHLQRNRTGSCASWYRGYNKYIFPKRPKRPFSYYC